MSVPEEGCYALWRSVGGKDSFELESKLIT